MRDHPRLKIIGLLLILPISIGCRTTSPKKTDDLLDGNGVRDAGNGVLGPGMDDQSASIDPSAMWSPANRRANAMFQFLVAEKFLLRGDPQTAEAHFESAYNLDPNSFTGSQLVRSKILINPKSPEGLTEARRMALLYPFDPDIRLLYGQVLLIAQDFKEAEIQLRRAIELNPRLELAYVALARGLQEQDRSGAAVEVAKKMVKANPESIQGWSLLSRILLSSKQIKESLDPARRAWELQENNPELALIYALSLDLNKRGKEAVKLYEQLYRFNPGNSELVQRMVGLYKELGNLSNALTLLDDMIENSREEVPGLKMQKVIILWELGRNDEALKIAQDLESELPESDRTIFMAAIAHQKVSQTKQAIEHFAKIQNESVLKPDAMRQQALLLREDGKLPEALDLLKALCSRPDVEPIGFILWAEVLADAGRYKDSVDVMEQSLVKFPGNLKLLFSKGAYQERSGDLRSAEETMRYIIGKNPQDAAALNFLGYMLADEGRNLDEAEDLIRRALKLQPENGGYMDSLGWVYYKKKLYKKSLEILEKAVLLDKEEGVIWEHIGDSHVALGDKKKALENYKEALLRKNEARDQSRIQKKFDDLNAELGSGR